MPDPDQTPVLGVEDDPIDDDWARVSTPDDDWYRDVSLVRPTSEQEELVERPGDTERQLTIPSFADPISVQAAGIHREIHQLLRLHRDIHDGIELAADQVQDKRIDFAEAGPEVTTADVFLEFALVFFLETPLAGMAFKRAFRFAADAGDAAVLTNRAKRMSQLEAAVPPELAAKMEDLNRKYERFVAEFPERQRADQARQKPDLKGENLLKFFAFIRELDKDYAVGAAKAAKAQADKKPADLTPQGAGSSDSVGVHVKAQAQALLRGVEFYLGIIASETDMLRDLARSQPLLAATCSEMLGKIASTLSRPPREGEQPQDPKREVFLRIEKLIWALLVAKSGYSFPEKLEPTTVFGVPIPPGPEEATAYNLMGALTKAPPPRVCAYFRSRFYANDKEWTDEAIVKDLEGEAADFSASGGSIKLWTSAPVPWRTADSP